MKTRHTLVVCLVIVPAVSAHTDVPGPTGILRPEEVAGSPLLKAAQMAWHKDRLLIADPGGNRILAFRHPDQFELIRNIDNPGGIAIDSRGQMIVAARNPNRLGWVGRLQGLPIDAHGNFYIAGAEAHTSGVTVAVITPDGKSVRAMILKVPGNISNLALGGPKGTTLFESRGPVHRDCTEWSWIARRPVARFEFNALPNTPPCHPRRRRRADRSQPRVRIR